MEDWTKPRCYVAVIAKDGFSLGIAVEDQPGYYKTDYPTVKTYDEAVAWADSCNKSGGIEPAQAMKIVASSMRVQNQRAKAKP
jgi:hypothetical protein